MFKYYNPLLSKNGDVLPGRYVRLFTAGGAEVDLFADESGTPISTESGVANAAVSDTLGMVRFYVANGTYDIRLYDEGDNFVSAEVGVPMLDAGGVYDDLASTDAEKGAALVKFSSGDTVEDLASDAAGKGASLVTMEGGGSAEAAILARPTATALASSTGGAMVGLAQGNVAQAVKWTTPQMHGAAGDGATDDATAIAAAIASGDPIDWGGFTYRIASQIAQTVTSKIQWRGNGATIVYDGAHAEYAIRLSDTAGVPIEINGITIDGGKLCNKPLDVRNNTSLATPTTFRARDLIAKEAKRDDAFADGAGMQFRGSFDLIHLVGGGVSDCELPAGQGTSGSIGISGIDITWYSTTSYARRVILDGVSIEKVYSSDLDYKDDQDGLNYRAPTDGSKKVPSLLVCKNSDFRNCYGRSIKTQVRSTIVTDNHFSRDEGFNGFVGNPEIDSQTGDLIAEGNIFDYANDYVPSVCVGVSGSVARPGMATCNNIVNLESGMTLPVFALTFPSTGVMSSQLIEGNKIYGTVTRFFDYIVNGPDNFATLKGNWVQEVALDTTTDRALVRVTPGGGTGPHRASIELIGNIYAGTETVALVRDAVPGNSMFSTPTSSNNRGFTVRSTMAANAGGLKTNVPARIGRVGPLLDPANAGAGYHETLNANIGAGATVTFPVNQTSGAIILFAAAFTQNTYATIMSIGNVNLVINKGSGVEVGQTSEPGSGTFRIWISAANEISVKNNDSSARNVMLFVASVA